MMVFGVLSPLRAGGSTIDDKKAEAAQLEARDPVQRRPDRRARRAVQRRGARSTRARRPRSPTRSGTSLSAEAQRQQLSDLVAARGAELYQGAQDPTSLLPNTNIQSVNELGVRTQYGAVATGNDEQLISNLVPRAAGSEDPAQATRQAGRGREGEARPHLGGAAEGPGGQLAGDRAAVAGEGSDRDVDRAGESAAGRGQCAAALAQLRAPGQRRVDVFRHPTSAATRSRTSPPRHREPRPRSRTRRRSSESRTSTRRRARTPSTAPASR